MPAQAKPARVQWTVYEIFKIFGAAPSELARDAPIRSFGLDSYIFSELLQVIQDEFGVAFDSNDLPLIVTLGDLLDLVVLRAEQPPVGPDIVTS